MFKAIIQTLFPDKTESIPFLLCWFFIMFADGFLAFWLLTTLAPDMMAWLHRRTKTFLVLALGCGLWILEATVYNQIRRLFR